MAATYFRYDGTVRDATGRALPGASVAVLTQPAVTTTLPGSPLASIFAAPNSNTQTVSAASWLAGVATLTLNAVPADVVVGSYISVTGINPAGYNGIVQITAVSGLTVSYALTTNPGVYVSGGSVATSALPNPIQTDNLGNYFFYALPNLYTVQIYSLPGLPGQQFILPDQPVVTSGGGSVTSVGLVLPAELTVTNSPVSTTGNLTAAWATEAANKVLAGPTSGVPATPSFRTLVPADFPAGVGTVTSVALTLSVPAALLTAGVTGSPVTTTGTLALTINLANQNANSVFAGPTSGGAAAPSFRSLVAADFPGVLLQTTTTSLSSANLLALLATPITLVAAPGAGFTIVPLMIVIEFFGGSIAYTDAGGAVSFNVGSATQALASNGIFLVTVTPNKAIQRVGALLATDTAGNPPTDDNAALTISKATNNFAAGNGTAKIIVHYLVLPTT